MYSTLTKTGYPQCQEIATEIRKHLLRNAVRIVSELQKLPVQSPILIIATDKGIDTQWIAATFNFVLINQKST